MYALSSEWVELESNRPWLRAQPLYHGGEGSGQAKLESWPPQIAVG